MCQTYFVIVSQWLIFSQFITLRIPDKTIFEVVVVILFLSISFNMCIGYSKELYAIESLLSAHNICFGDCIRKYILIYTNIYCLSGPMLVYDLPSDFWSWHACDFTCESGFLTFNNVNVMDRFYNLGCFSCCNEESKIVIEYDQEIPQSQTADNPLASQGRAAQPSRDTRKTN